MMYTSLFDNIFYIFKDGIELGLIWALLALGVFISFRILDFADLTVESSIVLGSAIMSSLILKFDSIALGLTISLIGGFIAGATTAILHTKLKIPSILAGIITMTGLYSVNLRIMGKSSIYLGDANTIYTYLRNLINDPFISKSLTSLLVLGIVVSLMYLFFGTEIGMSIRATGMNKKMAKTQGINTDFMIILGLAISNAIIALSGALIAMSNRAANIELGRGTIVIGLASIIIGEVIFGKRTFKNWLVSVVLGSIIFQMLIGLAIAIGLSPNDLKLVQAVLIAVILAMPVIKKIFIKKGELINVNFE